MKKIEFGFANEKDPNGSWQEIGIKEGLLLTEAEYYGAIKYNENHYIIAKVIKDEFNHYPDLVGNFIVRPALIDLFTNGSGIIYLDQEQSLDGHKIENYLNKCQAKSLIKNIDNIINICESSYIDVNEADKAFSYLTSSDCFIATSIKHEVFEEKNEALKKCKIPFSKLLKLIYKLNNPEIESKGFTKTLN